MDPHVAELVAFCASALGDALVVGAARGVFARAAEALPDGGRALRRLKGLAGDEKSRFCNGIEKELLEIAGKAFSGSEGIRVDRRALRRAKRQITHIIKRAKPEDYAALAKARAPEAIEQVLRRLPRKWGRGIREADRQWFDELVSAVAREYTILAPWSSAFEPRALNAILSELKAIRHDVSVGLENDRVTHSKLDELLAGGARSGRLLFGGRPDVAFGFRERAEQGRLRGLVVDRAQERTVLVGMAGCGKSQLASALAQWCGAAGWGLVAWINASSKDSVRSDLVELARRLGIDMGDNPTQDQAVRRCLDHLQSAEAGDRLVVFDNVEDFEDVAGVVPRGVGLRVVATTRSGRGWRAQGWERVDVGVFPRAESVAYLLDAVGSRDAEAADAVAGRLGDLPLAVAQAAATASNEGWTLRRYLERLEKYSSEQVIRPVPGDSYTDDVSWALLLAVDSALGRIEGGLREVARLQVGALAVLAESGVPTRWVDPRANEEQTDEDTSADERNAATGADAAGEDADAREAAAEDAHLALTALLNASVVQQTADGGVTMLHRLQGQVLRENWNREEWAGAFDAAADLLDRVNIGSLPRSNADGRRREARDLIDQLRAIAAQGYSRPLFECERVVADLPHVLFHATDLGLPNEALALRGAVSAVEEALGPDHPGTLASQGNLADAYRDAGRLDEAIPLFEKVLADSARLLGDNHPDTLTSRGNLAYAYESAGRL
ncbi:tetratricopeptide repeat protein, partial [Schaalia georgiae]